MAAAATAADCTPTAELAPVTVRKVVDGDTVVLADGRRLRLIGINAPELGRKAGASRQAEPDEPGAQRARQLLAQQLPEGQRVWLQAGADPRDNYGRTLAHLFLRRDGGNVEAALLGAGAAWHVAVPPNLALTACLRDSEQRARQQRLGLWRGAELPTAAALDPARGGFLHVTGRVERVDETRHSWWLELDGLLVVRLDKRDLVRFDGLKPAALHGRQLTVRGWASVRKVAPNGRKPLVLPLRHPAMME